MGLRGVKEYLRPSRLDEALALLRERGERAWPIGGGIDLVLFAPREVEAVVDLGRLPLRYVRENEGRISIGAIATLREVLESPVVRDYLGGVIPEMLHQVASPLLRNLATIGGTLVSANPWSDVITLFLALGAEVVLSDGKARTIPLEKLYPARALRGTILTEVRLPSSARESAAAFWKFSRTAFDVALLNCATFVRMVGGRCVEARVVAGGTPQLGARLPRAEACLVGSGLDDASIERAAEAARESADVREDRRASADYRRELVLVGVKRSLHEARGRLAGGER